MEIYEIKNLDCSDIKNRKKLLKEVMECMGLDERPDKETLHKICKSLVKKYGIKIKIFKQKTKYLLVSLEVEPGTYSTYFCESLYEMMLKYVLFVYEWKKYKRKKPK